MNGLKEIRMNKVFVFLLFVAVNVVNAGGVNWKNKKPFADYWQQDIAYTINAKIDEKKLTVGGDLELVYTNNSPDSLKEVFFHLYQNAFQKDAYYHKLQVDNGKKPRYGLYEKDGLGTKVNSVEVSKGIDTIIYDNTLMKIVLNKAILPHESVVFNINFKTYWGSGSSRRRMKAYYVEGRKVHFNGVHWYPRMAVYDRKFGWNTNQHLDKEFYGDFGSFNVSLDFANDYIVEATGALKNESEVLPRALKESLHISNFYHRGLGAEDDTLSIPVQREKGKRKVWKYQAENVHDFAFTADPTYRIDEKEWNGIKTIAVVEERHAPKWKNAAEFAMEVIKVYSTDFGMYEYPKMVVADANDGMEYPMLTLDSGKDPLYKGLFAHEIAHNWFYGMIGSNETYRAFMDEGFTQFLTVWSLEKIDGEIYSPYNRKGKNKYHNKYKSGPKTKDLRCYYGYLSAAIKGEDPRLNTHSSGFDGGSVRHGGGYGQVYTKTAVMLFNLQYVLGDSLFLKAMQNYVHQWKFAHPYPEDFRKSFVDFTKVDLNWFFDQWLESTKTIDYKIGKVKKLKGDSFEITFSRVGEMQMPIDFQITTYTDSLLNYHIPNTWFIKKTNANVLPKWYGWGKFNAEYKIILKIPGGIYNIKIDPTNRLADINPLNNSLKFPYSISFDPQVRTFPNREEYKVKVKPDFWWNNYDGVKVGVHLKGDYFNLRKKLDAKIWMNTSLVQSEYGDNVSIGKYDDLSYDVMYEDLLPKLSKKFKFRSRVALTGGLHKIQFGFHKVSHNNKHRFGAFSKSIFRSSVHQLNYALYENQWNLRKANNSFNLYYSTPLKFKNGKGSVRMQYRSSAFLSDYNYDYFSAESKFNKRIKKFYLKSRVFGLLGFGLNWAPESMLYLAGANPEALNENKFTQAEGFFQRSQTGFGDNINTFHSGGGLNLRGYSGYLAPENINGEIVSTYKGTKGASLNLELEFDRYLGLNEIRRIKKWITFKSYGFMDAGVINLYEEGEFKFAEPRMDAGFGGALTFKKFYHFETTKPVTFRFDFPLFLSRTPNVNPESISFKWLVGVNRAF